MRLTTKIIIGIILSIFLLSLLHIIVYSFTDRKHYKRSYPNHTIRIPKAANTTGINIEPYRVIVFETEQPDTETLYNYYFTYDENGLFIHPATTTDAENKLFLPQAFDGFISTQTTNDTLTIKLQLDALREKYGSIEESDRQHRPGDMYGVSISGVNLYLHTSNIDVINKMKDMQTYISRVETDSIKIYAVGELYIDSCITHTIEPIVQPDHRLISVTNSVAKVINFDLDKTYHWHIDNCVIETRNYTGSGFHHTITLSDNESGTISWLPKNKDAELNLKFKGDSAQIIYQTQSISN